MPWKTWGDAFDANLRKGYDHGYAAWRADQWEKRHMDKQQKAERAVIWNETIELAAQLHESINPASDDERQSSTPGAGAMGAVIEYRDKIRELKQ